jgi:redox-sensitive bicupin YhaK (pirin superfamily)
VSAEEYFMIEPPSSALKRPVAAGSVELVLQPRSRDLGEFTVRRVLPAAERRMVGPFIFFDHMGPVEFPPGKGVDVRPHPHICLATVTYLFEGEIVHRDNLGYTQTIKPGAVNWMTAGRGIVHSERTSAERRMHAHRLHGIQSWVALPLEHEETEPSFVHYDAETLPRVDRDGVSMRVIAGTAYGARSPVRTLSETFYVEADFAAGASLLMPDDFTDRGAYVVSGKVVIEGAEYEPGALVLLRRGSAPEITAAGAAKLMLLGGEPLSGEREVWWNFVASSSARMEQAKRDWKEGRFAQVPGEVEFIPLPE